MDVSRCQYFPSTVICPLSAQFFRPSTTCSNLLLNNVTKLETLVDACGITAHSSAPRHLTVFDESSTSLVLFTNEIVVGVSPAGQLEIVPSHAPPSCVLINKLQLSSLRIGGRIIFLNLRADAFNLEPPERFVVRHVHALKEALPFADSRRLRTTPHLHPKSRHFLPSIATVVIATISVMVVVVIGTAVVLKIRKTVRDRYFGNVRLQKQVAQTVELAPSVAYEP